MHIANEKSYSTDIIFLIKTINLHHVTVKSTAAKSAVIFWLSVFILSILLIDI